MADPFVDEVIKVFGGTLLDQDSPAPEAIPLTHFHANVQSSHNTFPCDGGGIPSHVKLEVLAEASVNPGNPTDVARLMLWISPSQPDSSQKETFLMGMSLPTDYARKLAAELLRGADRVDAEP